MKKQLFCGRILPLFARKIARAAAIATVLVVSAAGWATTVIPMSVEEMTRAATDVVEARAVSSRAAWNEQHTLIYTYTTFQVTQVLKGARAQEINVKQPGGTAGGYTQKVSGVHHAQIGEEALLFLRPSAAGDGTHVVVGLVQGNFRMIRAIDGSAMVTNGISGARALQGGVVSEFTGSPMKLTEAEARIRRSAR